MIVHALDTNAVIALLTGRSPALAERIMGRPPGSVALSAIVMHELYFGAHKSRRVEHNLETLRLLAADFPILEFDAADAFAAGEIRAALAAAGTPIGPYDLLIAAQARARGLTLVTGNVREFERVAGLAVENWMG